MAQCPFPDIELFEFTESQLTPVAYCNPVELELDFTIHADETCDSMQTASVTIHLFLDKYLGESRFEIIGSAPSLTFTLLPTPVVIGPNTYDHYTAVTSVPLVTSQHFDFQLLTDASYVNRDHAHCQVQVNSNSEITDFDPAEAPIFSYLAYIVGDPDSTLSTEVELDDIAIGVSNGGILTAAESMTRKQAVVINNVLVINQDYWISHGSRFAIKEGGAIVIKSPYTLTIETAPIDGAPWVLGCDAMWDRIEVESGASLVLSGAAILDGTNAITVQGGATVNIEGSDLVNNKIGVYKPYGTSDATINISSTTIGVNSTGLLPPNAGSPSTQGVFINHQTTPVLLTGNTYLNLQLGVNAQNSNAISTGETFTDIPGAGIYMGSDGLHGLTQSGGTFDNVRVAIEGRNINIVSSYNQMDNVSHGYRLYNGKTRSFDIHDNTINADNFGVLMFNWNAFGTSSIADNEINIAGPTSPDAAGIRMAGMPHFTGEVVSGNVISIQGAKKGIDLQDCVRIFAIDNAIIKQDVGQFWDGIGVQGGVFVFPYCNNIRGGNIGGTQRGISISQATNVRPSCNTIDSTLTGIRYDGANLRADVRANSFNSHNNGLEVGATGILGAQHFRGNRWVDSLLNADGLVHFGGSGLAQLSQFTVNTNEGSSFGTSADPANFLVDDDSLSNLNCSGGQYGCTSPPKPTELDDFDESDCAIAIALDTMAAASYPAAERWTAKRQLYRSLMEVADSISYLDDCLEDFYNTADTTTVGQFEQLRKDMLELFQPHDSTRQTFDDNYTEWNGLSSELITVMDGLLDTTISSQDSTVLAAQQDSLLQEITNVSHVQDSLDQLFQADWTADASALLSVNTAITATHLWEHNQRNYNRVWLQMVANDQAEPDSNQMDALLYIAYQCPFAGGEAVYQARALLGEGYAYDDSTLCAPVLPLIKKHVETTPNFTAYPNPGQHYVVVELEEVARDRGTVTLTDLLGRTIQSQTINDGDQQIYLFLDAVPAGMYHLTVSIDSKASSRLFSIVK